MGIEAKFRDGATVSTTGIPGQPAEISFRGLDLIGYEPNSGGYAYTEEGPDYPVDVSAGEESTITVRNEVVKLRGI
jgi:hypothetical protein